uniref:Uncharacterized protein n=1 Tax=Plectus sambesii TaxID=2011161 RepID=A0A914WC71_9BILA
MAYVTPMNDFKSEPVLFEETLTAPEKLRKFCKKYFLEGQKFHDEEGGETGPREIIVPAGTDFLEMLALKHRKMLGICIPQVFFFIIWLILAISNNWFPLYLKWWNMAIIMVIGTIIGGATCEGSGAVTFPIMTLLLHITPNVSRDYIYMSQSVGITAAAFTILFMGVALEWHSIIFCSIGSSFGLIIGLEFVAPLMSKEQKKMFFVSIWFAFACALYLLNRMKKRKVYLKIQLFTWWKAVMLVATGYVGGTLTSFGGTGACICSFSILTLAFSISEKIATQTSVVLMAGQTMLAFFWRAKVNMAIAETSWEIIKCTWPISAIGGPLGGLIGSYVHRQTLACAIYFLEFAALVGGFVVVRPGLSLTIACVCIIVFGFVFFYFLSRLGLHLLKTYPDYDPDRLQKLAEAKKVASKRHIDDVCQSNAKV